VHNPCADWRCRIQSYFDFEVEHWVADKHGDDILVLDDGSVWQLTDESVGGVKSWIRFSRVEVSYSISKTGEFQHVLSNKSYGQQRLARFLGFKEKLGRTDTRHDLAATRVGISAPSDRGSGIMARNADRFRT
jgi:hypothetical protein